LSASFVPLIAVGATPALRFRDRIGRMPSSPRTTPLSAQDATKDRLRENVEGFFFPRLTGEDGKRIPRLLLKSSPGLAKSTEAIAPPAANRLRTGGKIASTAAETLGSFTAGMRSRLAE